MYDSPFGFQLGEVPVSTTGAALIFLFSVFHHLEGEYILFF
jgi:hypothetical protein